MSGTDSDNNGTPEGKKEDRKISIKEVKKDTMRVRIKISLKL